MYSKKLCSWYHTVFLLRSSATEPVLRRMASGNSEESKGWKQVPPGTKRKATATPELLKLLNRFTAVKAEEELGVLSSRVSGPTDPEPQRSTRRKRQLIAVDDSLLKGTEAPDPTCCIEKFAAAQGLRSRLLWND